MKLVKTIAAARKLVAEWRKEGKKIALVPTMGALHEGHLSLIKEAKKHAEVVVVSDFVNPTQFGPKEDFAKYPRTLKEDCAACEKAGVAAVFAPSPEEMYFPNRSVWVNEEALSAFLCGAKRPGHFRGVCTVVAKLFLIFQPDVACFGKKDAQQLLILERMVRDLNFPIKVIECPLIREPNGLARSSRNKYLNAEERKQALCLSQALKAGEAAVKAGKTVAAVKKAMEDIIKKAPLAKIDYVSVCDRETLLEVKKFIPGEKLLLALAVFVGKTRLIDNVWLTFPKK